MHTILWRRLSQEGHDACRYRETPEGWMIDGTAVFTHADRAAMLSYHVMCDPEWASRGAAVSGWIGSRPFRLDLWRADDGLWRVNGHIDRSLDGLQDIDLGFTPATNTTAIRRLRLPEGSGARSVAVWLDDGDWTVKPLVQTYRHVARGRYAYESPLHDYGATLLVDDFGTVTDYPELWKMVSRETG
ncbi:putative glycolipid-binding domain-containing protein [Rhodobacter sp. NSM]|uniref:putative glycolipid-binding domain-containing protein n=1 Tax=Rhodobacter sp. NSM TaxID=3457501 RepID=UPI003FD4E2A9